MKYKMKLDTPFIKIIVANLVAAYNFEFSWFYQNRS